MTGSPKRSSRSARRSPMPETLTFARRLFARTVETPGGLKIHTIHGFCERLLHLFPFEANVPARFEVLDDHRRGRTLERGAATGFGRGGTGSRRARPSGPTLAAETSGRRFRRR